MDTLNNNLYLTVKDYSVSKEQFNLYKDNEIDLVYTYPQPEPNQLSKYYESEDYISHTDGKRSLFEKVYQIVKSIALKNKVRLINELNAKGNLLDIGAGTGDFLIAANKDGWNITGIEPSEKAKSIAIKKGVQFVENTNVLQSNSFDVITMWHVLEHVPDVQKQIQELERLLKPNGSILIAVPNFNSFDAKYYGKFWAAFDAPRHLWHFSKTAIKVLFEREGLQLKKVVPMPFDAFYVSLLSEKYKSGKMNFINAFGSDSNPTGKENKIQNFHHTYIS